MLDMQLEPDNSPIEDINITTIQLFFSTSEAIEFKELCKKCMMKMYPNDYAERNVNDFLLQLIKIYNNQFDINLGHANSKS